MEIGAIVILGVIGLIVFGVIIVTLIKFLKGSVKLILPKTAFTSGEIVSGKVSLKTKKAIESNGLIVELEAYKQQRHYSVGGSGSSTRMVKVYSQATNVEGAKNYPAGYSGDYEFKMKIPSEKEVQGFEVKNDALNAAVKLASNVLGGRLRWKMKVRLDAKGLDLTRKKKIYVNLMNSNSVQNPSTI